MPYVNKPRPYKKEYDQYHGTEEQKTNRAQRNAARAKLLRSGAVKKGDGKDVHHVKMLAKGGSTKDSNTAVVSRKANRGWRSKHPKVYKKGRK